MSKGAIPDPSKAAVQGLQESASLYPFQYLINALQQTGGNATLTNPTGKQENYDFTGLGTADVQNQTQDQMAQALLDIQNQYGSQYIEQALKDLKQSDPQGYQAYQQLASKINDQNNAPTPNLPLATSTQDLQLKNLAGSQSLTPEELKQVQQGSRANNVASGVFLGNAPRQAEVGAVVDATDRQNNQAQQAAGQYLAAGVSPSDIQYQQLQQDLANYGAFINGQTPTAQFSQIGGAQTGAAPYSNTGYNQPTINEGQAAGQGIANSQGIYAARQQQANPYLAGLNFASQGLGIASNAGFFNNNNSTVPQGNISGVLNEYYGNTTPQYNPYTSGASVGGSGATDLGGYNYSGYA